MSTDHVVAANDGSQPGENADGAGLAVHGEDENEVIHAAGCVVYRLGDDGPEVLVVHRPRYDDWDLPKGKREDGESDEQCARRETREESGYDGVIERELAPDTYRVKGRDKLVKWYLMRATGGDFEPNDEVDRIQWLPPDEAQEILSYGHARTLVGAIGDSAGQAQPASGRP